MPHPARAEGLGIYVYITKVNVSIVFVFDSCYNLYIQVNSEKKKKHMK